MSASDPTYPPERGAVAWMARNPVAANLLLGLILIAGTLAIFTVKKEVFPTFPAESLTIKVPYPGSSPEEVEEGIVLKIEEAIQDIQGIKKIRASAREGNALITVELNPGVNVTDVVNKVKVRVDGISSFPRDAEEPIIEEVLRRTQVLRLTAYGPLDETTLKQLGDTLRDDLLDQPGITQVTVTGMRDYKITLALSESALRRYGLHFDDVVAAVRQRSLDLPAGTLRTDKQTITLRSQGQARTGREYADLVLLTRPDGTRVRVGDVATVLDGFEDPPKLSRFNRYPAVTLRVDRIGDQDALAIGRTVRDYVKVRSQALPEGVSLAIWSDRTDILKGRIQLLLKSAGQGALLVILALALFLDPRLAFWVVVGVPFCFLGTLTVMSTPLADLSINVISLFGFIMVLGILVDDAIVTAESAFHTLEKEHQGIESIIRGVKRVMVPTIFGVLTTILAFMPMLFLTEGIGRLFSTMASVVILCLMFSIIETKLILPAHLRHIHLRPTPDSRHGWLTRLKRFQMAVRDGLSRFAEHRYQPLLHRALRYRYMTVALFVGLLVVVLTLIPAGWLRTVFFPNVPSDYIRVDLTMPTSTPYTVTHAMARRIEASAEALNQRYRDATGSDGDVVRNLQVTAPDDETAEVTAALIPSTDRRITSVTLAQWWREAIGPLTGVKALTFDANAGRASIPIDIELQSDDLDQLRTAMARVKDTLRRYEGVFDVRDTFDAGIPEVDIRLTPQGEALGLGQAELARQVRQAFFGAEIQRIQRGRHEVKVYARLPENERNNLQQLRDLWIQLPNGGAVPFPVVGTLVEQTGVSTIERINRHRVVNVQADLDKSRVAPEQVLARLRNDVLDPMVAATPGLQYNLAGEAEERAANQRTLLFMALLMFTLIYTALAVPLRSYGQPLLIMAVIPFGTVGALLGHLLFGKEISIISLVGIIALTGIVVNDSLVLIDYINQRRRAGDAWRDAVAHAGVRRFRAVVLTSLTTFLGLLPIQLETSIQAQFLKPMAISVAFGVLFASVVTLLLVPSLCYIADDVGRLLRRGWQRATGAET